MINKIKKNILDYFLEISKQKLYIWIIAVLFFITEITVFFIRRAELIPQMQIKLLLLTLMGTALIILPKIKNNYVNIGASLLYLLLVPFLLTHRIELTTTGSLDGLSTTALELNIAFYLVLFLILFALIGKTNVGFPIGILLSLIYMLGQYYVIRFRGNMASPADIKSISTAMEVIDAYNFTPGIEALESIWIYIFCGILGFKIDIKFPKKLNICLRTICGLASILFVLIVYKTDFLEKRGVQPYKDFMINNQVCNGTTAGFFLLIGSTEMEKPDKYSVEKVTDILNQYTVTSEIAQTPDIIFIMIEAWSDLNVLADIKTNTEYMTFTNYLRNENKSSISGLAYSEVLGGLTCNSEYEALTGNSLALMCNSAIPYNFLVNSDTSSMARILNSYGYNTDAMHSWSASSWRRSEVYQYFGFEHFTDINNFNTEYELSPGNFVTDDSDVNELIYLYEHRDMSKPWFMFNVTVQNHSVAVKPENDPFKVTSINGNTEISNECKYITEGYLYNIAATDRAIEKLITYFENVERPTVICLFGDHQPRMDDEFYSLANFDTTDIDMESEINKYIVPYIIWNNYGYESQDYGDISINYLSTILTEYAGLPLTQYQQFLMDLRKKYPILTLNGCMDSNGNFYSIEDLKNEPEIIDYSYLEYNDVFEK